MDVLSNKVLGKRGAQDTQDQCLATAIQGGFFIASSREGGSVQDVVLLFRYPLTSFAS